MQGAIQSPALRFRRFRLTVALLALVPLSVSLNAQTPNQSNLSASGLQASYVPVTAAVPGTALDRVVAIVNGDVILDSDVDEEQRFDSMDFDDRKLGPNANAPEPSSRSAILERLINRELILQQLKLEPHRTISDQELDSDIEKLRKTIPACARYKCMSDAGWKSYLASIHVTEAEFRAHWLERLEVLGFTEQRFRMGIRITTDQEKTYYDQQLIPEYNKAGVKPPPFDTIADRIQEVLVEQQVSALLSDWLHSLRAQGSVLVMHPGEDAP